MRTTVLIVAGTLLLAQAARAEDPQVLLRRYDCHLCHAYDETKTGPAYVDIAARYRGNSRAVATLTGIVRKGAHGSGPWHMPPSPQVPDGDAKAMVEYILAARR